MVGIQPAGSWIRNLPCLALPRPRQDLSQLSHLSLRVELVHDGSVLLAASRAGLRQASPVLPAVEEGSPPPPPALHNSSWSLL